MVGLARFSGPTNLSQQLVLLGVGLAHLHFLKHLTQHPLQGVQVTLVSARTRLIHAPMVARWVEGRHTLADCTLEMEALVQHSGVRWLKQNAQAMDANASAVLLDDGNELPFDLLSINGQFAQSRDAVEHLMPGARQNALLTWPLDAFCALWPRVTEMADAKAQRIAVICNGVEGAGIELALAIRHRVPGSSITLIAGEREAAQEYPVGVQTLNLKALRRLNVTVLPDHVAAIQPGEVVLGSGARLACDVPVVCNAAPSPVWAADSGLAMDETGAISTDVFLRSTSHPHVFAPPQDGFQTLAKHAASSVFTRNLLAVIAGQPLTLYVAGWNQLRLTHGGGGEAFAHWGQHVARGYWAGWLKQRLDRQFMGQYRLR